MDYSRYRFRAVVDWIEIGIQTVEPTNFQLVQRTLRKVLSMPQGSIPYVKPRNAGAGGAASSFVFRLYDPQRWSEVTESLAVLGRHILLEESPQVTAIEISLDAYSNATDRDELAELAGYFYYGMTRVASKNRRVYREGKGSVKAMPQLANSRVWHLLDRYQIGVGNKLDDRYQHIYLKCFDNKHDLLESEIRARTEITFRGSALPCRIYEDWASLKFESLQKPKGENLFRFRELKPDLAPLKQLLGRRMEQIGERKARPRVLKDLSGYSGSRLYGRDTKANTVLNEKARAALRELSRRWQIRPKHKPSKSKLT